MNEFELIDFITHNTPRSAGNLTQGVGDDCAIIECGKRDQLITADALVEGIHFKLAHLGPRTLGRRTFNVNASDIAAMGGNPRFYTVCIALPPGLGTDRCREIFDGMSDAAHSYNAILIGGDTVASPSSLFMAVTMIGDIASGESVLRSGSKPGDALYVTGTLGDGALGLQCLERGISTTEAQRFIGRYREPSPRIAAGRWLARTGMVTAMIDVSDGLVADVGHLAHASKTGYEITMSDIPTDEGFDSLSLELEVRSLDLILAGGDDYELAFTVARNRVDEFEKLLNAKDVPFEHPITRIGTMVADTARRTVLDSDGALVSIQRGGYDHLEGVR